MRTAGLCLPFLSFTTIRKPSLVDHRTHLLFFLSHTTAQYQHQTCETWWLFSCRCSFVSDRKVNPVSFLIFCPEAPNVIFFFPLSSFVVVVLDRVLLFLSIFINYNFRVVLGVGENWIRCAKISHVPHALIHACLSLPTNPVPEWEIYYNLSTYIKTLSAEIQSLHEDPLILWTCYSF